MKRVRWVVLLALPIVLAGCGGCTTVESGSKGVRIVFGKADEATLDEGMHFYNPLTTTIVEMNVRETKTDVQTSAYTRDNQKVQVTSTVNFYPDKAKMHLFFQNQGTDWADKIIVPSALGSITDVIGKIAADDLVANRGKATIEVENELKLKLANRNVTLTKFEITAIKFEHAYEQAVEAKVVAIQQSQEAKNRTEKIKQEAAQKVLSAEAEAQSMRIRSQALKENKGLVEYESVQKWDGKLPEIMGVGPLPFINLNRKGD